MARAQEKKYPLTAKDYELYEEVGEGVSATVYRAHCVPLNENVAIKVLDLEKCNNDLDGIRREVQTMLLINHPNVLRAHCSFTVGHNLWVVMPYMAGGSCLHIMKSDYPEGFEEPVIATLLHEVLKALVYVHAHGHIHRDVKSGNILIDYNGTVKLADFGVAACMFDTGDRQRSRNTFVGTPCWMAPEVMQQLHGYDFKADIWSFGITALELAHGHAPFSKYPPMKVLLMTLQNAPPGLDYERDKRFSKSFKDIVAACLVKDPKKRPSSEKLLKHPFFKHARSADYLSRIILDGMTPLGDRFRVLKAKEADMLVQNKALYEEQLSQQEYIRGISAWNFNMEDLKNQAALIQDDPMPNSEDSSVSSKNIDGPNDVGPSVNRENSEQDDLNDIEDLEESLAAFPIKPLQALKGCFDVCEDDNDAVSQSSRDSVHSASEQKSQKAVLTSALNQEPGRNDARDFGQSGSHSQPLLKKYPSVSQLQDNVLYSRRFFADGDRYQTERNYSGQLQTRQNRDFISSSSGLDLAENAVVERRGRFKVTSAELSFKEPSLNHFNATSSGPSSLPITPNPLAASILPLMHSLLHQNTMQREGLTKLIKFVELASVNATESNELGMIMNELSQLIPPSKKERELQAHVNQMHQSIGSMVEELHRLRTRNSQLERKSSKKDDKIPE